MWVSIVLVLTAMTALTAVQGYTVEDRPKRDISDYFKGMFRPYIVGGSRAKPHQFPWQAYIRITEAGIVSSASDMVEVKSCGGTLIHPSWVLTAAHCTLAFDGDAHYEVILGAHNLRNHSETSRQYIHSATQYSHPKYDVEWHNNDIALIKLPYPATLNDYVKTIRLPTGKRESNLYAHKHGIMSGWGQDSDKPTAESPAVLMYVKSNILGDWNRRFRYGFFVGSSKICVSGLGGKGTCHGDSGGPLVVYEKDGLPTLVGVTSVGTELGCESGWSPAFSRVTSYIDWIQQKTKLKFD